MIYTVTFTASAPGKEASRMTCAVSERGYDLLRMISDTPGLIEQKKEFVKGLPSLSREQVESLCDGDYSLLAIRMPD